MLKKLIVNYTDYSMVHNSIFADCACRVSVAAIDAIYAE